METKNDYQSVSIALYGELELQITRKNRVTLEFEDESGKTEKLETVLTRLQTNRKVEYLTTAEGRKIRLDRIVTINGNYPGVYC